jgi:hypothetical protein
VTEHLAACSPCFNRYGELLAELKSKKEKEKGTIWGGIYAWSKDHPVLAATVALCSLLIAIGVGFLLGGIRHPNAPPIETNRKPNPTEPRNPNVAYLPFGLDLSALAPIRGSEPPTGTQRPVLVPNSSLDLTVTLPLASPEGRYDLKLTSKGQIFWSRTAQAHLQNGKTVIQVQAEFTQTKTGDYNLELRSPTGLRLIQPVSIRAAVPKSEEERKP